MFKEKLLNHLVDMKNKRLSSLLAKNASYEQLKAFLIQNDNEIAFQLKYTQIDAIR